ncbi:GNAT family protein [Rothia koreensis]|uniref:GNAT family N-acetyltransferase n=1 Tax=Rothia koreensis TaxID=592378 RepID=UPI003F1E470B
MMTLTYRTPSLSDATRLAMFYRRNRNHMRTGSPRRAESFYTVDHQHANQGIATSAVHWAVDYAFTALGLHRLQGETLVSNHASQAVLSKCGFTQYGLAPKYLYIDGSWQDHALYQLINITPTGTVI